MISKNEDRKHTLKWVFPGKAQAGSTMYDLHNSTDTLKD